MKDYNGLGDEITEIQKMLASYIKKIASTK